MTGPRYAVRVDSSHNWDLVAPGGEIVADGWAKSHQEAVEDGARFAVLYLLDAGDGSGTIEIRVRP